MRLSRSFDGPLIGNPTMHSGKTRKRHQDRRGPFKRWIYDPAQTPTSKRKDRGVREVSTARPSVQPKTTQQRGSDFVTYGPNHHQIFLGKGRQPLKVTAMGYLADCFLSRAPEPRTGQHNGARPSAPVRRHLSCESEARRRETISLPTMWRALVPSRPIKILARTAWPAWKLLGAVNRNFASEELRDAAPGGASFTRLPAVQGAITHAIFS